MITSFHCQDIKALFYGERVTRFVNIERVAIRKLVQLNIAATVEFLRSPPGNSLEALKGDRKGQFSIRINQQWRVCFCFKDGNASQVEICDYH